MVSEGEYFEDLEDLENIEDEGGQTELYEHRRVVADSGQNSVRVDKFLMDHLRDTSRNRIQKAAEAGYIMANGKPVKSNYKVKASDVITLMLDRPKRDWEIIPEDIPLDVVYEDDQLLLINKPTIQKPGEARDKMIAAMEEVRALSELAGTGITKADLDAYVALVDTLNPDGMPSMRQDGLAKRYSEVDFFAGTVIRKAKQYGLYVPVNQSLYDTVKQIESAY